MATDFLREIIGAKEMALKGAKNDRPFEQVRDNALKIRGRAKHHAFITALTTDRINVIAEFKRRSPSKGVIREDVSAESMAALYQAGGAAAISVLTEEDFFDGSLADLLAIRAKVSLPLLRKDFILDEYQVYESAVAGADAILLIVAVLADDALKRLRELAQDELGMDALVEVHTRTEMQRALNCGARLIGVNNRNLKTLEVSLETSKDLAQEAPGGLALISESGLESAQDLRRLRKLGYSGFLIGESLMRAERPDEKLRSFIRQAERDS